MKLAFSTVVRGAPVRRGGELVLLDWDRKAVEQRTPIFPANPELRDPNPRGNTRGGRGIALMGEDLVVASYHTLRLFDRRLAPLRDVSHPLMVGLHEVFPTGDGTIWVASTAIDAALEIDMTSGRAVRQIWPREMPPFQAALGVASLAIDKEADNRGRFLSRSHLESHSHLHFNAITRWRGEMYGLFNSFGAIANLDRGEVVIRDDALRGGHNLVVLEDGTAFINGTRGHCVHIYDLAERAHRQTIDLMTFSWVRDLTRWYDRIAPLTRGFSRLGIRQLKISLPRFVRGLDLDGDRLFVGMSPASILCLDWRRGELVEAFNYSRDIRACIHGLKVLP